jgi:hypothetical protein
MPTAVESDREDGRVGALDSELAGLRREVARLRAENARLLRLLDLTPRQALGQLQSDCSMSYHIRRCLSTCVGANSVEKLYPPLSASDILTRGNMTVAHVPSLARIEARPARSRDAAAASRSDKRGPSRDPFLIWLLDDQTTRLAMPPACLVSLLGRQATKGWGAHNDVCLPQPRRHGKNCGTVPSQRH